MERIITKSFARLMGRGIHRGFITHEELNKSLGKRNLSSENLAQAFIHILDEKVTLVEKKSDFKVHKKRDSQSKEEGKSVEKSDDPIRMYLREMGGVELLSREGEIAIAKRIEAGKDVMLNALSQSPITAQQFFEWDEKLQKDQILVREIIDIDTNYMEDENTGLSSKHKEGKEEGKEEGKDNTENDESKNLEEDELIGGLIVEKALSSPLKRIASNAGENGAIVVERVKESAFEIGYNAATNEFVDMYETGIIDPTKVTRSTLQNAASIASMILTTECIIVDKI